MKITPKVAGIFQLPKQPQRIISLVPSLTELLYDLGLEDRIVGITKFCVHPSHFKSTKSIIGGTKKVNFEKILELLPDLIVANKEENTLEMVNELQKICPVWVTNIATLNDSIEMISDFGKHLGCDQKGLKLNEKIAAAAANFTVFMANRKNIKVTYLIWKNPYMAAGNDTFINEMLEMNRFENICQLKRYPEITISELGNSDLILLSSEPFPFTEKDANEFTQLTKIKTIVVDGEMFSWYGSRVLKAFEYFKKLHLTLEVNRTE